MILFILTLICALFHFISTKPLSHYDRCLNPLMRDLWFHNRLRREKLLPNLIRLHKSFIRFDIKLGNKILCKLRQNKDVTNIYIYTKVLLAVFEKKINSE